eukprot:g6551.t1
MNRKKRRERSKKPGKYLHRPPKTQYPTTIPLGDDRETELDLMTTGLPTGLAVTWLGTSSGSPTISRNVSSILVRMPNTTFVFDVGEGTQMQIIKANVFPSTIRRIFITHLHGDHCFGLPGLLTLVNQLRLFHDRGEMLYVYGPPGLEELMKMMLPHWFERFRMSITIVEFTLDPSVDPEPYAIDRNRHIFIQKMQPTSQKTLNENSTKTKADTFGVQLSRGVKKGYRWEIDVGNGMTVTAAQLQHRVPCWGYVLKEADYSPAQWEIDLWRRKQQGIKTDDQIESMDDEDLFDFLSYTGRKVVILGDTCNSDTLTSIGENADLLSHEATYASEMHKKAILAQHSTAKMAGSFAKKIKAKKLFLTHFSPRYRTAKGETEDDPPGDCDVSGLVEEAKAAFGSAQVEAASDFTTYHVPITDSNKLR